jgi:hypothetical protein
MTSKWGWEESEWEELQHETRGFLAEQARLRRTTTYTELNAVLQQRTGLRSFDFSSDRDRAGMGALLGEIAIDQLPTVGYLVSSIVTYLNENDAGPGFYALAAQHGLLTPKSDANQRLEFWAKQVAGVYDHYTGR